MTIKSVLITGGMGLLGSNLAAQLAAAGYSVTVVGPSGRSAAPNVVPPELAERIKIVSGDISDEGALEALLKDADAVFHKSASVGMAGAVESARDHVGGNLLGTACLVDALKTSQHRLKKVILDSSISVYGEGCYNCGKCGIVRPALRYSMADIDITSSWNPLCPTCAGKTEPCLTPESAERSGESVYAVTRKAQEDLLIGACRSAGTQLSILRNSYILGPGQSWHNPFTRLLELLATNQAPKIHEDGQQTREFIFIEDLVRANVLALEHDGKPLEIFNISAIHMPVVDILEKLASAMSEALNQKSVATEIDGRLVGGEVRHCWVDCAKAKQQLGFNPEQTFDSGVRALTDWFVRFKGLKKKSTSAS